MAKKDKEFEIIEGAIQMEKPLTEEDIKREREKINKAFRDHVKGK